MRRKTWKQEFVDLEKCPIIDYYYSQDEIADGDMAEKVLTEAVLNEMKQDNAL